MVNVPVYELLQFSRLAKLGVIRRSAEKCPRCMMGATGYLVSFDSSGEVGFIILGAVIIGCGLTALVDTAGRRASR